MASLQAAPGITELLADLLRQISALMSVEIDLARAELAESSARAVGGLAKAAVGAVLLLAGLFFVLAAICAFLVRLGLPVDLSCLIVGAAVLVAGGVSLRLGVQAFEPRKLLPRRSLDQISSFIGRL